MQAPSDVEVEHHDDGDCKPGRNFINRTVRITTTRLRFRTSRSLKFANCRGYSSAIYGHATEDMFPSSSSSLSIELSPALHYLCACYLCPFLCSFCTFPPLHLKLPPLFLLPFCISTPISIQVVVNHPTMKICIIPVIWIPRLTISLSGSVWQLPLC